MRVKFSSPTPSTGREYECPLILSYIQSYMCLVFKLTNGSDYHLTAGDGHKPKIVCFFFLFFSPCVLCFSPLSLTECLVGLIHLASLSSRIFNEFHYTPLITHSSIISSYFVTHPSYNFCSVMLLRSSLLCNIIES